MVTAKREPEVRGLTGEQIIRHSSLTLPQSQWVKITAVRSQWVQRLYPSIMCTVYSTHDAQGNPKKERPERYQVEVIGLEKQKRLHLSKIKVSCTCPHHVFFGDEYALWRKGASTLRFSNGEAPVVRNPTLIPHACKHVVRVLQVMIQKKV